MAEVRPLASGVGLFEAQVLNFDKVYRAIANNAAAARKQQVDAVKSIEKQMDVSLADKRAIRPQDSDYIEEKRQEVYNYFYQNQNEISSGGKARAELKMKMGEFTSAVNQSASLNRRGMSLNPAWKEAMKDENEMDASLTDAYNTWALAINDPKRKDATFDRGGVKTNIDEFDVPDLKYFKKFDETKDLDKAITDNVKPFEMEIVEPGVKNKFGLKPDDIKKFKIYDSDAIINQTVSVAMGPKSRGFLSTFNKQLELYKTQSQEDKDLEFKSVVDAYRDLAGKDISTYFKKEGGAGIDNELELAAFRKLQSHLPQVVKDAYDYRSQRTQLAAWQYQLSASKWDYKKKEDETLDLRITRDIKGGKFSAEKWNSYLKPLINVGMPNAASVRYADATFSEPDKNGNITLTYTTQNLLTDPTDNDKYVTTKKRANELVRKESGVSAKVSEEGIWYSSQERSVVFNAKDPGTPSRVSAFLDQLEESIQMSASKDTFKSLRSSKRQTKQEIPGQTPRGNTLTGGSSRTYSKSGTKTK